jgi:Cu(I)/Ag(I) efflux system protein CusF
MLRPFLHALAWALGLTLGVCAPSNNALARASAPLAVGEAGERYATTGVIKSFGPGRAYVNVAHADIPGYMKAMTMSFEPRAAGQLASFEVGDAVRLRFTVVDGGRRLIDSIEKRGAGALAPRASVAEGAQLVVEPRLVRRVVVRGNDLARWRRGEAAAPEPPSHHSHRRPQRERERREQGERDGGTRIAAPRHGSNALAEARREVVFDGVGVLACTQAPAHLAAQLVGERRGVHVERLEPAARGPQAPLEPALGGRGSVVGRGDELDRGAVGGGLG